MLIRYDEGYHHHHHGSVLIGCVHVPDECHHGAEHAGYHHFRIVFDPVTCHHEPHLACVADEKNEKERITQSAPHGRHYSRAALLLGAAALLLSGCYYLVGGRRYPGPGYLGGHGGGHHGSYSDHHEEYHEHGHAD